MKKKYHAPMIVVEFSDEQIRRIDEVENAVYDICKLFTDDDKLEWDMQIIGQIAELIADMLSWHGHNVYYPYRIEDKDGMQEIHDWYEGRIAND